MPDELTLYSHSSDQTRAIAAALGALLRAGDIVTLQGDLGSGKTTFTAGLVRGWGSPDPVTSPTFVMINRYDRLDGQQLHHVDAYRIESAWDAESTGLPDLFDFGETVVLEWPEQVPALLPDECLHITLTVTGDTTRTVVATAHGPRYCDLLAAWQQALEGRSA